ncbi:hypothetical protein [Carnobacterium funditum]|uniref:hypothetical protein n=1 Tax=Carnobacterium funditum TaxID=2752 RepID=UPI000558FC81|nr:hypothetical protein [Carnobacterium funditum]
MDNLGTGKGHENTVRDAAALRTYINDENLNELPEEELDRETKEEPKPEDFEPFKDPEKLKKLKKETPSEDKESK